MTAAFALLAALGFSGRAAGLPTAVKAAVDAAIGPVTLTLGAWAALGIFFLGRRLLTLPAVAWAGLNAALVLFGLSLADPHFMAIVASADNLPIVAMVGLLGFFTWLATRQAVENDNRLRQGGRPVEEQYSDTVLTWPDAVYLELIGAIVAIAVLMVWSLAVRAPLESPANPLVTPNPAKAPWYFVGLQEMLVYFPPWMAGVTIPALIVLGLMAIPYLDFNPRGNGYYTIDQRPLAYLTFQFGFLGLWVLLILMGVFLRGPNWSFFGIYEPRDVHRLTAVPNVHLAEFLLDNAPRAASRKRRRAAASWPNWARSLARSLRAGGHRAVLPGAAPLARTHAAVPRAPPDGLASTRS